MFVRYSLGDMVIKTEPDCIHLMCSSGRGFEARWILAPLRTRGIPDPGSRALALKESEKQFIYSLNITFWLSNRFHYWFKINRTFSSFAIKQI